MRIMQPRIGFLLVTVALLATGVSSMAVAAQNQVPQPECYSTCASGVTLTQAWTLVSYGNEQIQVFHVTVRPTVLGLSQAPTGTVAVKSGSTTLCTIVLSIRGGSCSLSPEALPAGSYSVRGYYSGDATFSASVSRAKTFQVSGETSN
jgi:hypothetical protein